MAAAKVPTAAARSTGVSLFLLHLAFLIVSPAPAAAGDNNHQYEPCGDTTVERMDGFTIGFALAAKDDFSINTGNQSVQLSPCDRRLSLSNKVSRLAVFRPKVDEISVLTVNTTVDDFIKSGVFMVAFAGRKYAARSHPVLVSDDTSHVITSFTLVLEFKKGRLQNLYWKKDSCSKCKGDTNGQRCINNGQDCGFPSTSCIGQGGKVDCSLGIQVAFAGTDKHYSALNSWYEVSNLRQYSLFGLYSNLKSSFTDKFKNLL